MDTKQPQPRQYLKLPASHAHHHQRSSTSGTGPAPAPAPGAPSASPRAPVTAHPTATIADSAVFQGPYSIAIGAETVIHPRARLYSFDGPIVIGEGCIISEKCVVGQPPQPPPAPGQRQPQPPQSPPAGIGAGSEKKETPTRISHNVTLAPLATIHPGTHIHSAVTIDTHATIHTYANISSHSKICASCHVPPNTVIRDWTVVWGSGAGIGQRRKRAVEAATNGGCAGGGQGFGPPLEGRVIEDARLVVLQREREALVKLIGATAGAGGVARRR